MSLPIDCLAGAREAEDALDNFFTAIIRHRPDAEVALHLIAAKQHLDDALSTLSSGLVAQAALLTASEVP